MKNRKGTSRCLAGHSDRVEFRNLKVFADYSPSLTRPRLDHEGLTTRRLPDLPRLFNGKDLTGWKGLAHKNAVQRRKRDRRG